MFACTLCSWLVPEDRAHHRCKQQLPLGEMIALPCPSCGSAAWYSYGLDRYLHANAVLPREPCWLAAVQGNVDWTIEIANERAIAQHARRHKIAA
jgi:hypothetical protein